MVNSKWIKRSFIILWAILTLYLVSSKNHYHVYFSPDTHPKHQVLRLINNSRQSIRLAMYTFTEKALGSAIVKAKQRGVNVEVIVDQWSLQSKSSQIEKLLENNVPVFIYKKSRSLMHHKFAVFDNKHLCTGSLNWTAAACHRNQENILISDDRNLCKQYSNQFKVLKERANKLFKSSGTDFVNEYS